MERKNLALALASGAKGRTREIQIQGSGITEIAEVTPVESIHIVHRDRHDSGNKPTESIFYDFYLRV